MHWNESPFGPAEHADRLARARDAADRAGLAGLVCIAPENLYYLAGYDSMAYFSPQALLVPTDAARAPALIVRDVDEPLARETGRVDDLRTYHLHQADVAALVAGAAAELGFGEGPVGVDLQSHAVTGAYALALVRAFEPARIHDATGLLGALQFVKSAAELDCVREAARQANAGLAAARAVLPERPTELELAGAIEHALRAAGSEYWAVPTEIASGPRTPGGHAAPTRRRIESGDLVHVEFAGVHHRYHAVAVHTMALGDPGPRARAVYEIARESLAGGIAACRPGAAVADVDEASLRPIRAAGLEHAAMMRFGIGIGIGYPPVWVGGLQIDRYRDERLEPGMTFYLHACLELPEEGIGVVQGTTFALTGAGLEQLVDGGDVPLECVGR